MASTLFFSPLTSFLISSISSLLRMSRRERALLTGSSRLALQCLVVSSTFFLYSSHSVLVGRFRRSTVLLALSSTAWLRFFRKIPVCCLNSSSLCVLSLGRCSSRRSMNRVMILSPSVSIRAKNGLSDCSLLLFSWTLVFLFSLFVPIFRLPLF